MVTLSQNFDQVRMGLQAAREFSQQAQGNLVTISLLGEKASTPGDTFQSSQAADTEAETLRSQAGAGTDARFTTRSALNQALSTINEMGLPAAETENLRSAIQKATLEDKLGVFEQMQIKAGLQAAEARAVEVKLQRTSAAAAASEARQDRIEGQVNVALGILTELEMRYASDDFILSENIPGWNPGSAQAEAAPTVDPQAERSGLGAHNSSAPIPLSPSTGNATAYSSPNGYAPVWGRPTGFSSPVWGTTGTSSATAPIADLGNQSWTTGWTSSSSLSTGSGSTAAAGNDFNPRALSEAVWGSGYKPQSSGLSAVEPLSGSTGNLMSDFLLDRGNFTPKTEDESEG